MHTSSPGALWRTRPRLRVSDDQRTRLFLTPKPLAGEIPPSPTSPQELGRSAKTEGDSRGLRHEPKPVGFSEL
jgi:hypothetical protein